MVASWQSTRFTDRNTCHKECKEGPTWRDLQRVRFDIVQLPSKASVRNEDAVFYSAEIMVKTCIPAEYITVIDGNVNKSASSGYPAADSSGSLSKVRFPGDRWRYHRECASYYRNPV